MKRELEEVLDYVMRLDRSGVFQNSRRCFVSEDGQCQIRSILRSWLVNSGSCRYGRLRAVQDHSCRAPVARSRNGDHTVDPYLEKHRHRDDIPAQR